MSRSGIRSYRTRLRTAREWRVRLCCFSIKQAAVAASNIPERAGCPAKGETSPLLVSFANLVAEGSAVK